MKVRFVDNEKARSLTTIRETDLIWRGQETIDPVSEGAIVRAFIPGDANPGDVDMALDQLEERAKAVAIHRLPKKKEAGKRLLPLEAHQPVRQVIKDMITDPDLLPFVEEALSAGGL